MKTVRALFQNLGTWFYFQRFFLNSYEWLLREIKAHNCVGVTPRQRTQVCTPIQTDLSKFLNKYTYNFFFWKYIVIEKKTSLLSSQNPWETFSSGSRRRYAFKLRSVSRQTSFWSLLVLKNLFLPYSQILALFLKNNLWN